LTQTSRLALEISKCIDKRLEVIVFCLIAKNEHPLKLDKVLVLILIV